MSEPRRKRCKQTSLVPLSYLPHATCCSKKCLQLIDRTIVEQIRDTTHSLPPTDWVLQYLTEHESSFGNYTYLVGDKNVCPTAFCLAYGVPISSFYRYVKIHREGQDDDDSYNNFIVEFIKMYIANCTYSSQTKSYHLPSYLNMKDIFCEVKKFVPIGKVLGFTKFTKFFKEHFPCVEVPEVKYLLLQHSNMHVNVFSVGFGAIGYDDININY